MRVKLIASQPVILWDVSDRAAPKAIVQRLRGHTNEVPSAAFSPNGKLLASGSGDGTVILWDVSDRGSPAKVIWDAATPTPGHESPSPSR